MKKLGIVLALLSTTTLTACNQANDPPNLTSKKQLETPTNILGNDPSVLNQDELAQIGDLGVESEIKGGTGQPPKGASLLNVNRTPKIASVNPDIQPMPGGYVENVISFGLRYLGTPYEFGSDRDTITTFDCSDFTRWVYYKALGMELPNNSRSQARYIETHSPRRVVNIRDAKRGDLLFFMSYKGPHQEIYQRINKSEQPITHVGIYLGDGKMLHTMSIDTGGVRIDEIFDKHFEWRFLEGGSVLP